MITRMGSDGTLMWWCQGCEEYHGVPIRGARAWKWNGSMESPTLQPSVLVNVGGGNSTRPICHIFMTDGKIQFLADCTHAFAGRTVAMQDEEKL